jgi:hypothetical protein
VIAAIAVSLGLSAAAGSAAAPKLCGPLMLPLIRARFRFAPNVGRITRFAVQNGYGLAEFAAGEGAGDALFHREAGRLCLVDAHGGRMNAVILISRGVPRTTAVQLDRAVHGARAAAHG